MPAYRRPRLHWGKKSHHSIQGDLLKVGPSPVGYSNEEYATIGIDYATGMQAMLDGWNVRVAVAGSMFLGHQVEETFLYLGIAIPKHFDVLKFSMLRVSQYLSENYNTTVEITAQPWWFEHEEGRKDKLGVKLWIEEIYENEEEPALSPAEIYRLSQDQLDFYREGVKQSEQDRVTQEQRRGYAQYVQRQRDACMPVISRSAWLVREEKSRLKEREFENRRNRNKTYWKVGDVVGLNGKEYLVGKIDDIGDQWGIRLDQKFYESAFIRVPK